MNALSFQKKAIDELISDFKLLWNVNRPEGTELILKSPTGSGKTFITSNFINALQDQPDWNEDVAFVWITFSDDLAMQSKDKFSKYFSGNLKNQLLTTQDFSQGILNKNDILFINWQKLVSKKAEDRILRKPDDERNLKENGVYFEDIVETTHNANREIIMIIDESHKNVTDSANRDVISKLKPKLILKVSATPFKTKKDEDDFYALKGHDFANIVEVSRDDVVAEGLIKEKIVCQTEDELKKHSKENLDELMIDLAIERRNQIAEEWKRLGKNINPLVLIQLPNDDNELEKQGVATKESIVRAYLAKTGVSTEKIASWLDGKKENLDYITQDDCSVDFLLFKIAAGTGWDCPRAHILVMFREIKTSVFQAQTLGRILRMPYVDSAFKNQLLTTGYLYTNYKNNEVGIPDQDGKNKPKIFSTEIGTETKKEILVQETKSKIKVFIDEAYIKTGKNISDKQKKTIVQTVVDTVNSAVVNIPFQSDKDRDDTENYKNAKEEITEKSEILNKEIIEKLSTSLPEIHNESIGKIALEITNKIVEVATNEKEHEITIDPALISDVLSRADYGDIGKVSEFQKYFVQFMNDFFEIKETHILANNSQKLVAKGIELNTNLTQDVMVNAEFHSEERTNLDKQGKNISRKITENDVEKIFTWKCYEILGEQTEADAKIGNRARSWGPFKEALRQWFNISMSNFSIDEAYRIFLNDTCKVQSIIKQSITFSLKKYRPILNEFIKTRQEKDSLKTSGVFTIKSHYAYSDEYAVYTPSTKSFVQPFYLQKEYVGRKNEISFIDYLETSEGVKRWFKNGDNGSEYFGIKYFSKEQNCYRLFYPDWIVIFDDGHIGIFDTKSGQTAKSEETKEKAEELQRRITTLNETSKNYKYSGGITVFANGQWYVNENEKYEYNEKKLNTWKTLSWKASE